MTTMPSRTQIEGAGDLDWQPRGEKMANITIEACPSGLCVKVEYTGALSSIPSAIERLRAAGVLDLVKPVGGNTPARRVAAAERVEPLYQPDGTACCPVHHKPLVEGNYGLYCPAKAQPGDAQNDKGYCALRFKD